jgi:signal transduction histidine kinase
MDNALEPILYIDDEVENLRGFQFLFKKYYNISVAKSADEAFDILKNTHVKLIIADQKMPKMTGVDFFEKAADLYPNVIRIILTGYSDIEAIIKAINKGRIFKYVTKPWDKDELKLIIDNALWSYNIAEENRVLINSLKQANINLEDANKQLEQSNLTLEQKVKERTHEILEKKKEIEQQHDLMKQQRDQIARQNEELEEHRTKLEQLVIERTSDLIEAKEKAEQSDKLKSAFLANFSHEIRTPMNAIMGFSQILYNNKDITDDEKKEFLELVLTNSQYLLNLINEILDISRIEAGEMVLDYASCNLNHLILELLSQYEEHKTYLKKSNINLVINPEIEELNLHTITDSNKLKQVLINLIENAFKFTETGHIEFGYKLLNTKGKKEILFFVKDTGIGIEDDAKSFIFERFRKVDSSTGKLYRGAGLGLAISKKLVEFLGGKIWVESKLFEGSTFYFTHPLKVDKTIDSEKEKSILTAYNNNFNWGKKLILIAEDEFTNYRFIVKALEKTKINLLWAKNGVESFEMIKKHNNIDLVLMDIRMPLMDGFEATRKIKEFNKDLPVIAQTAYALDYEKDEILKAGCDDYISKPYTVHELLNVIDKYILSD